MERLQAYRAELLLFGENGSFHRHGCARLSVEALSDSLLRLERVQDSLPAGIEGLAAEAAAEHIANVDRLISDWRSGAERFDKRGEILLAVMAGGVLVGVGGATIEINAADGKGAVRMRRFYVHPAWRRRGVGRALAAAVMKHALGAYDLLTVNAGVAGAAPFWEALGFRRVTHPTRTHELSRGVSDAVPL